MGKEMNRGVEGVKTPTDHIKATDTNGTGFRLQKCRLEEYEKTEEQKGLDLHHPAQPPNSCHTRTSRARIGGLALTVSTHQPNLHLTRSLSNSIILIDFFPRHQTSAPNLDVGTP
jgi:hypothetical protein